jgi:hypothetical protein
MVVSTAEMTGETFGWRFPRWKRPGKRLDGDFHGGSDRGNVWMDISNGGSGVGNVWRVISMVEVAGIKKYALCFKNMLTHDAILFIFAPETEPRTQSVRPPWRVMASHFSIPELAGIHRTHTPRI